MRTLLIIILVFNACAPIYKVHPDLQTYVTRFEFLAKRPVPSLYAEFKELDRPFIGQCIPGNVPHIKIDPRFWERAPEELREALMYHELGHCILRRGHVDEKREDGCYKSLMSTYIVSRTCYIKHYESYLNELVERN